jgi:uncharacterized protein (DUF927 family)
LSLGHDVDTREFFEATLPDTGYYYLFLLPARRHIAFASLEEMAKAVLKYDNNPKCTVYHACSSFTHQSVVGEDGKKKHRVPANHHRAKSLWIDVDCGEEKAAEKRGYLTKLDAWQAVSAFCTKVGLPLPLVVDSGNGIHCYWPLTKSIKPGAWQVLAVGLKEALAREGVLVDPTRTHDFSSVLRPPGSTNRKREPHRPVLVKKATTFVAPELIQQVLLQLVGNVTVQAPTAPAGTAGDASINEDLTAHLPTSLPSSAEEIANRCAQVAAVRDTKGDVSYEHWRGVIGLIKHCTEGLPLAEAWTEERAATGHSSVDFKTRYETWTTGPPTCDFFAGVNPAGCNGCPHSGKIKTPMVLGRIEPEPAAMLLSMEVDGQPVDIEVPPLPNGFSWSGQQLIRWLKRDGNSEPFPFCKTLFYPISRLKRDDGTYGMGIRSHTNKRMREFEIDTGLLASPTKLLEALGHNGEIVSMNNKDSSAHVTAYLRDSLEELKQRADELSVMTSFGWKNEMQDFLIGKRLYRSDGSMRVVMLGGIGSAYADHFPEPMGTVESYSKALNHVFDRPGMECLQYAIASGFGSVLTPFGEDDYHGLMVCLTGGKTGQGKTSACAAALYAFGDAPSMTILSEKGTTVNAFYTQMGVYANLPLLMDEYTNIKPEELSDYCYSISGGKDKKRLFNTPKGVRASTHTHWRLSPFVTTNKDLHAILALHTANSQAEAVRLIQIKVDTYPIPILPGGEVPSAMTQMRLNRGKAGEAFIRYVVANRDEVFALYRDTIASLGEEIAGPKYRFFRNQGAATLTALKLMNQLAIANFDYKQLFAFTVDLMKRLAEDVTEHNTLTAENAINQMVNELNPRILSTVEFRDNRDARGPEITQRIPQAVAGRYIMGSASGKEPLAGRLYLVRKEMRDWCMKHRMELDAVLTYLRDADLLVADNERFTLTRGTEHAITNQMCVVINMHKLSDQLPNSPKLVVHTGGRAVATDKTGVVQ